MTLKVKEEELTIMDPTVRNKIAPSEEDTQINKTKGHTIQKPGNRLG